MGGRVKRLELAEFPVQEVRLGRVSRYRPGVLEVGLPDVEALALQDRQVVSARLEVVLPGEHTRIFGIRDVVEPRVKVRGPGCIFPGVLGPIEPVGEGRDHRLSGVRLFTCLDYEGALRSGTQVERSALLDMWGPGAEASEYAQDIALVLLLDLAPGLPDFEAHTVVQQAEYRVARRLAETTVEVEPAQVEVFELTPEVSPALPRVVFIQSVITNPDGPHTGVGYYGMPIRESLNTLLHPNELLDGVMTPNCIRQVGHRPNTFDWMHHPILLGLYREHGRTLNFAGVVLQRIMFEAYAGKEITARNAAQLAELLKADAALITWMGGGNAFMDVMFTIRALERAGIKTTLITYEDGGPNGIDLPFVFTLPDADAIVSTGTRGAPLSLPEPERIVGPGQYIRTEPGERPYPARAVVNLEARGEYLGSADIWGADTRTCKLY